MKTTSLLIFSLLLTINSFAQSGSLEPIHVNKHFLVHSAGLPEEFLLFAPDSATQILFNPARANNFSTSFIYLNYISDSNPNNTYPVYFTEETGYLTLYPGSLQKTNGFNFPSLYQETFTSSKNPTFSAAALLNINGAKWLFELTNGINDNNFQHDYKSILNRFYVSDINYSADSVLYSYTSDSDENTSSLKISRIFQAGETNLSAGIFGIINRNNADETYNESRTHLQIINVTENDSSQYRNFNSDDEKAFLTRNSSRYAIGTEFRVNNKDLDYIGTISYQFGDNPIKRNSNIVSFSYDSSKYGPTQPWFTSSQSTKTNIEHYSDVDPSIVNFNNYFRHSINVVTPEDNIFLALNLFFSSGNISYTDSYNQTAIYTGSSSNGDTVSVYNPDNFDIKNWGVNFATGYALSKEWSDLFLLSGFEFTGSMELLEGLDEVYLSSGSYTFVKDQVKPSIISFTLPLYLNYSPARWVSVFGGLNYAYTYSHYKYNYVKTGTYPPPTYNSGNAYTIREDIVSQGWESYKSIYLGCELRHSSGLKIQLFFDEDFTLIRNWNVSVGYHF